MQLQALKDLLVEQLQDLYDAEHRILDNLPTMEKAASHDELRNLLAEHREVTGEQVNRLENVFERIGVTPQRHECVAMAGLIKEGERIREDATDDDVRDAGLIATGQRIEHYEIAGYGCARTYANRLGESEAADMLQQTLDEESAADRKMTEVAENLVNIEAASG